MKQAKPGDKIEISAKEWNDVRAATQMVLSGQLGADKRPGQRWTDQHLSIRVKNTTGSNVDRFDVLAIDDMVFNLEDNKEGTIGLPCLKLRDIAGSKDRGNVVVVQAPIKVPTSTVPGIDKGVMSGVTAAYVDVKDEDDRYIDVGDAARSFVSARSGGVGRIIWKPEGTGRSLCMVLIQAGGGVGGSMIFFEFDDQYGELAELCDDRDTIDESELRAQVIYRPPGSSKVEGEDENGYVTLIDPEGLLAGHDPNELSGRVGCATLITSGYTPIWGIVFVNLFTKKQNVHDWIVREKSILVQRTLDWVFGYCKLQDEPIEGTDCEAIDEVSY